MNHIINQILRKNCCVCGKKVFSNKSKYCLICSKFALRVKNKRFPSETSGAIWEYVRKNGYVCYYTGMSLNMNNPGSPWHLEFDHWIPKDPRKVVITSSLFNVMKTDLLEKEFWYYIVELDNHKKNGTRVMKRNIHYWSRLIAPSQLVFSDLHPSASKRIYKKCAICQKKFLAKANSSKYCHICKRFTMQMEYDKLPPKVIKNVWRYVHKYGYVCYYSGMALDIHNPGSPWYVSYDHCIPHNNKKVVLTTRLFNEIKTELSENEFWYFISQLAAHYKDGTPVKKRKLKYRSDHATPDNTNFL